MTSSSSDAGRSLQTQAGQNTSFAAAPSAAVGMSVHQPHAQVGELELQELVAFVLVRGARVGNGSAVSVFADLGARMLLYRFEDIGEVGGVPLSVAVHRIDGVMVPVTRCRGPPVCSVAPERCACSR